MAQDDRRADTDSYPGCGHIHSLSEIIGIVLRCFTRCPAIRWLRSQRVLHPPTGKRAHHLMTMLWLDKCQAAVQRIDRLPHGATDHVLDKVFTVIAKAEITHP